MNDDSQVPDRGISSLPTDEKGRPLVAAMSDREIAEETLVTLRATQDLVEGFIAQFNSSGAMGSIMSVMKMFGR